MVDGPFSDAAQHIVQTEWVGFFGANRFDSAVTIVKVPSVIVQFVVSIAPVIRGRRSATGCVFPFGFGGQSILVTRNTAEPFGALLSRVLRHRDGWLFGFFAVIVGERWIV